MGDIDPHLVGCRRNVRELAELLIERLRFHGMSGRADAHGAGLQALARGDDEAAVHMLHRAWADVIGGSPPDAFPRATRPADVDPDIGLLADALRAAVGNLKVYVRYGLRRADVPLPDVKR